MGIFNFLEEFLHASALDLAADSNYGIAVSGPELAVGVNEAIIPKLMVKLDVRAFRMRKINKRVNEFFLIHSQNPFSKSSGFLTIHCFVYVVNITTILDLGNG